MHSEPASVTLLVTKVLEDMGIPYLIGGSFASTAYGHIRTTQDVDIVAQIKPRHIHPFVQALGTIFYVDQQMIDRAIQNRSSFSLIHFETAFKVDIFIPQERPFDEKQLARRIRRVIDTKSSSKAYFASVEDTILSKLEWYRQGGEVSERQWRDVLGILELRGERLDLNYLQETAEELGISDLLELAIGTANRNT